MHCVLCGEKMQKMSGVVIDWACDRCGVFGWVRTEEEFQNSFTFESMEPTWEAIQLDDLLRSRIAPKLVPFRCASC